MRIFYLFAVATIGLNFSCCASASIDPKEALKKDRAESLANGTLSLPKARTLAVIDNDIDLARKLVTSENVNTGCDLLGESVSCLKFVMYSEKYIEMSKMLIIEKHANVNYKDDGDLSPIHWACGGLATKDHGYSQHVEICQLLVEAGAEINSVDRAGNSALMLAAWHGFTETVKFLLSKGADLSYKQIKSGRTALDLANQFEHEETYQVIKAAADATKSTHR